MVRYLAGSLIRSKLPDTNQMMPKIMARAKLARGPAIAMVNSLAGVSGSLSIWAIPPNRKRVILSTGVPLLLATREWLISWTSTEAKNRITVIMVIRAIAPALVPGRTDGK